MSYSFGKSPPRSLQSFGVAGLLGENCQVFYDSLFSTRHAGRISDLLSARLKKAGLDELRLRALVLFSIFEAYRSQDKSGLEPPAEGADASLAEPLVIECGADEEKVAIGLSFTLPEGATVTTEGLAERIAQGQVQDDFERVLYELYANADRFVIRVQTGIRRVEVISLLAIPGQIEADAERAPVTVVELDKTSAAETPKATAYTELGDLDYPQLLRGDSPGNQQPASPTGEIFARHLAESTALADAIRMRGQKDGPEAKTVISGTTQNTKDEVIRIKGSGPTQTQDQTVFRIGGAPAAGTDDTKIVVGGGSGVPMEQVQSYIEKIETLQKRVAELEAGKGATAEAESAEAEDSAEDSEGGNAISAATSKLKGLFKKDSLKKVWPFKKKDDEDADDEDGEDESAGPAEASAQAAPAPEAKKTEKAEKTEAPVDEEAAPAAAAPQAGGADPTAAANSLMVEIQAGSLDRTISKAQEEAAELKKDLGSARAKRWVEGLMGELVAEKSRLHDIAKKLNTTIRQKELEFRNKEQGYVEELRRRDEMLRQKNNALTRTKDQLSQVTMTLERFKSASAGAADDAHYKQKYQLSQKMMNSFKEENATLTVKVEELKTQVQTLQLKSAKTAGPTFTEYQAVQTKFERALRQAEEFKKQNQQLMEKLNDKDKKSNSPGSVDDLKKRLEAAMKLNTAAQKEVDQLQLKLEEVKVEEGRLQRELARANAELKALKGGGGSKAA